MYSRFSPGFVEASLKGEFRRGDHMPCPRCGDNDVKFTEPKKWLRLGGVIGLIAGALILVNLHILGQVVAIVAVGVVASAMCTEPSYSCKHCGYGWRFRDSLKWAEGIRHDRELS